MTESMNQMLLRSTLAILRSLARVLIKHGVSYAMFSEVARSAFVEAAKNFELDEKKLSDSRIAVITGLSRKEVKRLRLLVESGEFNAETRRLNRATKVLTAWGREADYLNSKGKPRVLPFDGDSPTLTELVEEFGKGVPPRAVVDELVRLGAIEEKRPDCWAIVSEDNVQKASDENTLKILGEDVALLIDTIEHNREARQRDRLLQRKVRYRGLSQESVDAFQEFSSEESKQLLSKLDSFLSDRLKQDKKDYDDAERDQQTGLGVFFFAGDKDEQ